MACPPQAGPSPKPTTCKAILRVQDASLTAVVADYDSCPRPCGAHQSLQLVGQLVDGNVTTLGARGVTAQVEFFDAAVPPESPQPPSAAQNPRTAPKRPGATGEASPARAEHGMASALNLEVEELEVEKVTVS